MAASEIEKLEARYAENPDGRYFAPLADAYRKAGRVDDALLVVDQGLTKHPDYLSAHIVLGRCHLDKKDDVAAQRAFERVLELDRENIIALKALAEVAERTGQNDQARRWLTRLLAVDSTNVEAVEDLERLGGPLAEAGAEEAEEAVEPVFEIEAEVAAAEEVVPEAAAPPSAAPVADIEMPSPLTEAATLEFVPTGLGVPAPAAEAPAEPLAPEGLEKMEFEAPSEPIPPPSADFEVADFREPEGAAQPMGADLIPFDDKLEWGVGERQSRAVHADDIAAAEARHEATSAAIEFIGGAEDAALAHPGAQEPGEPAPEEMVLPVEQLSLPPEQFEEPAAVSGGEGLELVSEGADLATDLPLIMPEEVTPPEELSRPSARQVRTVSPEPEPAPSTEPLITETMGELYLRQGFRAEAADVFRRLLAQRPDDAALRAKLAAAESTTALSASALGTEAVGIWLRRIAKASLGQAAPPPAPQSPVGPTPMEQAFSAPEPEAEAGSPPPPRPEAVDAAVPGEPARPASDQFSLDQIFGKTATSSAGPAESAPAQSLGSSFDEFFGAPGAGDSARPRESQAPRQSDDDLSAFTAWLHGLKR